MLGASRTNNELNRKVKAKPLILVDKILSKPMYLVGHNSIQMKLFELLLMPHMYVGWFYIGLHDGK